MRVPVHVKNALADGSSKRRRIECPIAINNNEFESEGGNGEPTREAIQRMRQGDRILDESIAAKDFIGSSSSSSRLSSTHDVFISFRDEEFAEGKDIAPGRIKAIRESQIFVVVLSINYFLSCFCLDELAEIIRCKMETGRIVVPIFYGVDPSDLQKQTGSFAEAFIRHKQGFEDKIGRVKKWREALRVTASLFDCDLQTVANGHGAKSIQVIVEDVLRKLIRRNMNVAIQKKHKNAVPHGFKKRLWIEHPGSSNNNGFGNEGGNGEQMREVILCRRQMTLEGSDNSSLDKGSDNSALRDKMVKFCGVLGSAPQGIKELEAHIQAAKELGIQEYKNSKAYEQMLVENGKIFYKLGFELGFEEAEYQVIAAHPNLDISFTHPYKVDGGQGNQPTNTEMASTDVQGHDKQQAPNIASCPSTEEFKNLETSDQWLGYASPPFPEDIDIDIDELIAPHPNPNPTPFSMNLYEMDDLFLLDDRQGNWTTNTEMARTDVQGHES